jgi:hypothetical protein
MGLTNHNNSLIINRPMDRAKKLKISKVVDTDHENPQRKNIIPLYSLSKMLVSI